MRKLYKEKQLDFDDVLLVPGYAESDVVLNSRSKVNLVNTVITPVSNQKLCGVPIIAANMDGVGTFEVARALAKHQCFTALHKHYSVSSLIEFFSSVDCHDEGDTFFDCGTNCASDYTFYSLGISDVDLEKFNHVNKKVKIKKVCFDVANGYMHNFYDVIADFREKHPDVVIMAGNVVTAEAVDRLHAAGTDIIKLGIGGGSVCTSRLKAGVGFPQFSCVLNAVAEKWTDALICSDGGCVHPGDVSKALAAGANFVMLGGMLSGTDEGGGEVVDGKIQFYGMSSKTANEKHFGGLHKYRSSEGRTVQVPYKGSIDVVIQDILGGLRSTCTYLGEQNLKDLSKDAGYIEVNNTHNRVFQQYTIGD